MSLKRIYEALSYWYCRFGEMTSFQQVQMEWEMNNMPTNVALLHAGKLSRK